MPRIALGGIVHETHTFAPGVTGLAAFEDYFLIEGDTVLDAMRGTRTPLGGPYRRRTVVQQTADVDDPFSVHMQSALDRSVKGVRVMAVTMDNRPFKRVYEPGNPDANAEGYVMYPDINVVEEMANLMTAQRNYEANVTTVDAVKGMYVKALEIGK